MTELTPHVRALLEKEAKTLKAALDRQATERDIFLERAAAVGDEILADSLRLGEVEAALAGEKNDAHEG